MNLRIVFLMILLLPLGVVGGFAQEAEFIEISGVVRSEEGPLSGVNILVQETNTGAQTNAEGEFRIEVAPRQTLVFSYLGMKTAAFHVPRSSRKVLIELEPSTNELDEVVVRAKSKKLEIRSLPTKPPTYRDAFGEVDLRRKGTSTYYIPGRRINKAADTFANAINSLVPGGLSRGTNSLNLDAPSLYVVDGQIYNDIDWFDWRHDIVHIFVEKSLMATVKYGTEGRGGVIIIETVHNPARLREQAERASALNKEVYQEDANPYNQKYISYEKVAAYNDLAFSKYVDEIGEDTRELRHLAFGCQAIGQHERAIQIYRQILAIQADDPQAKRDLAQAFALSGRPQQAWSTYLLSLDDNSQSAGEGLSSIEFQEMKHLYNTENLREAFPNALEQSVELEGMKHPITRLVLEWADPEHGFVLESVNPEGQVSQEEIIAGASASSVKDFFVDSTLSGEWQFNFDRVASSDKPMLLKVSIYRDWGKSRSEPEIRLFRFEPSENGKYKLLNLKV